MNRLENYVNIENIFQTSGEKRLLGALSVFREPIELQALSEQGLNIDELDTLVESGWQGKQIQIPMMFTT